MRSEQTQTSLFLPTVITMVMLATGIGIGVPTLTYNSQSDTLVYLVLLSVIVTAIFGSVFFFTQNPE